MAFKVVPSANGLTGTNYVFASAILRARWTAGGGDYLDSTGTLNGGSPTISQAGVGTGALALNTVNITSLPASDWLMIRSAPRCQSVNIDGVPAAAVWTAPASNQGFPVPADSDPSRKILVKRPTGGGSSLTFQAQANGQTIKVDRLKQPEIPTPAYAAVAGTAPLGTLDLSSEAAMFAQVGQAGITGFAFSSSQSPKWTGSAEFGVDPTYGFNYVRMGSFTDDEIIMVVQPTISPALTDCYFRYCIMLEDDIADGMTISGLKLPGLRTTDLSLDRDISWRMWHGGPDPANRGVWWFGDYMYFDSMTTPTPAEKVINAWLYSNRWHVIEGRAKLNTLGVADGISTIWVDGTEVYNETNRDWRGSNADAGWHWGRLWMNIYHGGQNVFPSQPIHYRIAEASWGSARIGVPSIMSSGGVAASHSTVYYHMLDAQNDAVEVDSNALPEIITATEVARLLAFPPAAPPAYPTWRTGLPVGQWVTLNTAASLEAAMLEGSNVPGAMLRRTGVANKAGGLVVALASGNNDSSDEGWQNNVIQIDLTQNDPQWTSANAGTSLATLKADGFPSPAICAAYYSDGLPCGRRTFLSTHYSPVHNKTFVVGSHEAAAMYTAPAFTGGPQLDAFNHATGLWAAAGTHPSVSLSLPSSAARLGDVWSSCMDPRTGDIFATYLRQFRRFTQSTGLWTSFTPTVITAQQQVVWGRNCFIDEARNEIVYHSGFHTSPSSPHGLVFVNISTYVGRFVEIPSSLYWRTPQDFSTITKNQDSGKYEFIGDQTRRGVKTSDVLEIDPTTGACTVIDTLPAPVGGALNRYVYLPTLKGIAYQPDDGNLMFKPTA
jgi:hypothetical protein